MTTNRRERLSVSPASVIYTLPATGRLMITAKHGGATHERIGVIQAVMADAGWLVCSGAEHDSRIDPQAITDIIVDRTSIMGEQAYPRIDFLGGEEVLFSVVGFGGLEPFDAALAQFGPGEALPEQPRQPRGERQEASLEDVGAMPFSKALEDGEPVSISFHRRGFQQRWAGIVERVNPAMGFINVTRPDFHLHLRCGAVSRWQEDENGEKLDALGEDQMPIGLVISTQTDDTRRP
jgi:hypothetical protein